MIKNINNCLTWSLFVREQFDIMVVGGGLVGSLLAVVLSGLGLKIGLVEKKPIHEILSFKDDRAIALSFDNFKYIQNFLGSENQIEGERILKIITQEGVHGPCVNFEKENVFFGMNVFNQSLKTQIYKKLLPDSGVKVFNEQGAISSKLILAADGRNSDFSSKVNQKHINIDYKQTAFAATLKLKNGLCGVAYERFLKTGPIALLPLPDNKASLIWSLEENLRNEITNDSLMSFLRIHLEGITQDFEIINQAWFPLSAQITFPPYCQGLLLMGDAAHAMHPVAGQGFNLAVRNIKVLEEVIKKYLSLGLDIGSVLMLEDYWKKSRPNVVNTMTLTHGLIRLFDLESKSFGFFRKMGMRIFEKSDNFKKMSSGFSS